MLRVLDHWRRRGASGQLELALPPRTVATPDRADSASAFLERLRALGLRGIRRCTLTTNRSTVVSFRGNALRVHRAFVGAPDEIVRAVVGFVNGRGAVRRDARRVLRTFDVPRPSADDVPRPSADARRPRSSHADDARLVERFRVAHQTLNRERFAGALGAIAIRVSRRMRSRLGHYTPGGIAPAEIAIARRHVRRDGWTSALDTLVHEMVHQWQHETGRPVAHDRDFRAKARAVGIAPFAKRPAGE